MKTTSFETVGDTSIMLYFDNVEGWEVYYRKPLYPWLFAFSIPQTYFSAADMMRMAISNIDQYQVMFEEV